MVGKKKCCLFVLQSNADIVNTHGDTCVCIKWKGKKPPKQDAHKSKHDLGGSEYAARKKRLRYVCV